MAPNTTLLSLPSSSDNLPVPCFNRPLHLRGGGSDDSDSGNEADDERDDSSDKPGSEDERSDSSTSAPASDPDHYNTSDADEKRDSHKGYQADSSECSD
jgi:hypothetical protein